MVLEAKTTEAAHAGAYGDKVVRTPTFDRVAREGVLFTRAFSAAPSCTPSRAAMLTGQAPHRLVETTAPGFADRRSWGRKLAAAQ